MDQLRKSVLVAVAFVLAGANAAATCLLTADDIKSFAEESMTFFPPSETSATLSSQGVQMDVVLGVVDVRPPAGHGSGLEHHNGGGRGRPGKS